MCLALRPPQNALKLALQTTASVIIVRDGHSHL
jgi:hypothetical protein